MSCQFRDLSVSLAYWKKKNVFPFLISRIAELYLMAWVPGNCKGFTAICVQDPVCLRDMSLPRSFLFMLTEGLLSASMHKTSFSLCVYVRVGCKLAVHLHVKQRWLITVLSFDMWQWFLLRRQNYIPCKINSVSNHDGFRLDITS